MPTIPCEVCGNPVEYVPGKVKKRTHLACGRYRNFLEAAVRAVKEMDPKPTEVAAREIRHEAMVASYRIGATVQKRDARGRFC
jgi:transposase